MLLLNSEERFMNSAIIARSSLEGMALLLWAKKGQERAEKYRKFPLLERYFSLKEDKEKGEKIDEKEFDEMKSYFIENHHLYLKKKEKKENPLKSKRKDYHRNWYDGKSIKCIFDENVEKDGEEKLYRYIYKKTSKIIHWTHIGLAQALESNGDKKLFSSKMCIDLGAMALASGFQSLCQTLILYDSNLNLGFRKRINDLRDEYCDSMEKQGKITLGKER